MPTKAKFTRADEETLDAYIASKSKQCGSLHERMKWLVGCKEELREYIATSADNRLKLLVQNLEFAVIDLETEVSYTKPAKPPYARRLRDAGDPRCHPRYEHQKNG